MEKYIPDKEKDYTPISPNHPPTLKSVYPRSYSSDPRTHNLSQDTRVAYEENIKRNIEMLGGIEDTVQGIGVKK